MARPIDADALMEEIQKMRYQPLRNTPTIDAVEVVRCKECKYAHLTYDGDCKYCDIWFPDEAVYLRGDDYCSLGERKESE